MGLLRVKTTECRIGIVGLYNSGKTVFLTSLLDHLEHHDPDRFPLGKSGTTIRKFEMRPPDSGWATFSYATFRDALVHGGSKVDFGQLVKTYGNAPEHGTAARYSPGQVIDTQTVVITGAPIEERVCTSHVERQNLSMRMSIRRMTRLTNAHSKKWENHRAALALYFAYYNFCRVRTSLTVGEKEKGEKVQRITPAMAAGLTDHVWGVKELLEMIGAD